MDRLNQLRGDADASRTSTVETSSLLGESYLTANDSTKYFSLSELDSNSTDSPSKEPVDDVTAHSSVSHAETIISNLSPIPKKSELDSFKIGEQIEAANILSGGVNIFDDNENSYDGDELVIDDAVTEGDDKSAELKLVENEGTFEKPDRSPDTNVDDAEAGMASKDTEVVLQIDGKNVDAIDIGNGLYLYRKDGEEELAAVQILQDDQQQPNIKFLKVRENAEGNLEVYEEIEIEVPKEVPTKEGKTVKNTSHIPIKDIDKVSEPISNRVTEKKSPTVPKDTTISEEELELNKDNAHVDSKTEVNLNGKMMKFSESRKSPVIGTFTPMTYHSTPNKEGIPLTKTMVDLQLHPNRHSENVKKTIEVHTDNCKQRLSETPTTSTKSTKDSNEQNKNPDLLMTSDKDMSSNVIVDAADQSNQECNKNMHQTSTENKKDLLIASKVNEDKEISDKHFENNDKDDKTEIVDIKMPSIPLEKPSDTLGATCNLSPNNPLNEEDAKSSIMKTPQSDIHAKINIQMSCDKPNDEVKNSLKIGTAEASYKEPTESANTKVNDSSATDNCTIEKRQKNENFSDDSIRNNDKNVSTENQRIPDVIVSNTVVNILDKSRNTSKTPEINTINSTERDKNVNQSQNDFEIKNISNLDKPSPVTTFVVETSSKLKSIDDKKGKNIFPETLSCSSKHLGLVTNITNMETQNIEKLKSLSEEKKINLSSQSEQLALEKTEKFKEVKSIQEESLINLTPAEIKTDWKIKEAEIPVSVLEILPKDKESKTSSVLKHQKHEYAISSTETEKISTTDLKTLKYKNKPLSVDSHSSINLTGSDILEVKEIDIERKNKPNKMLKGLLGTKFEIKSKQPENVATKVISNVTKPVPNEGTQSSSHISSLTNVSTTERVEVQKKNELKQNLPVTYKNTKVPLLATDSTGPQTIQNESIEVESSKNDNKKEPAKVNKVSVPKPINNNKAAVPFGKWTEANRQEFLNKIKESKVPINTSNTKQLKQPNDLNRRDVLQKIASQRQSNIALTKVQESNTLNKNKHKNETTAFTNKSNITEKDKLKDNKVSAPISKGEEPVSVTPVDNTSVLGTKEQPLPVITVDMSTTALSNNKKDSKHRKEINNQDIIDKTVEGIINRAVTAKTGPDDTKQDGESVEKTHNVTTSYVGVSLDEIESKMNELHGIPFVERPPHELPKVFEHENKGAAASDVSTVSKKSKSSSATSVTTKSQQKNQHKVNQPSVSKVNEESDEEIIEHEPVTGDIQLNKNNVLVQGPVKDKIHPPKSIPTKTNSDSKKETIITENDFDKFARRNSITYENCLTVNFDGKEHHNVVQTVVEKEAVSKKLSRNEIMLAESKAKSHKQLSARHINFPSKIPTTAKSTQGEDSYNKSNQSKVQIAYQTVMTAKRQQECPITIIEDKPVKVVFMDGNHEYVPHQLNVQGKELSPPKKPVTEWDHFTRSNSESLDSDILESGTDSKSQDEVKFKSKHQRKQVLTPVEAPELELIEPKDLGIEVSPKKKRKMEDSKSEKNSKSLVPKKSYLLNRNITVDDAASNSQDSTPTKELANQQDVFVPHKDPISAIDNLVKAAELLETQSETKTALPVTDQSSAAQQNTPVKRGRGRPRKYPLPEPGADNKSTSPVKVPTPQKKPRLIDSKISKHDTESEDDDDDEVNSDGELVKENWTMGKINENIVCPICNKLFRSENVVFKHVKHCTGPSPSRSDSDKRSPRRMRQSQELDWKSEGSKSDSMDADEDFIIKPVAKKRKSKEKRTSVDNTHGDKTDVIVIEDTPVKDRESPVKKREKLKGELNKTILKPKVQHGINNLVCEFCGKTFRQLSYLVNHRLQHKSTETKKNEKDNIHRSLFSCEFCKKEFRKLHHLVQHRIIHNPDSTRTLRKNSSEQSDSKTTKDDAKATEDQSAGFRCEPCDKSFRKLHHLVEHRETHDEINKKCNPVTNATADTTKPAPLHHCEICKKTFKKLQHLIEHKDHHLDTSSEKSDDKSVQSSLSTKDIIHECPLCYMVFPNEHSLNKHHIICQRKKKTAAKQVKKIDEIDTTDVDDEAKMTETNDENQDTLEPKTDVDTSCVIIEDEIPVVSVTQEIDLIDVSKPVEKKKEVEVDHPITPTEDETIKPLIERKTQVNEIIKSPNKKDDSDRNTDKGSVKSKKYVTTTTDIIKTPETVTPKKKFIAKDKRGATVTKRQKTANVSSVENETKSPDSSDDDEIRYMLNPDFKVEESNEGKLFMKVRAQKRSSLQIERPNSKDLMKRRISLQHPPKIPRLKAKPIPRKPINSNTVVKSSRTTVASSETVASTDSDDSDVKYSFPEPVVQETTKEADTKVLKQKIGQKRKSLSKIAKRKSIGKMISVKQKLNPAPVKQIKKRSADAEHRCDCGQLFSSAALLSRHTSLAHTPPRIRRRRSPPPDDVKPPAKRVDKQTRKTIEPVPSKTTKTGVTTRKSSVNSEVKPTADSNKTPKTATVTKTRRSAAHKGIPVPEKMRKLMEKSKK